MERKARLPEEDGFIRPIRTKEYFSKVINNEENDLLRIIDVSMIALLETLKSKATKATTRREKETTYGTAIIREEIDAVNVRDIDKIIKQLRILT